MPKQSESLTDRLSRYREIDLTVTGRKSGKATSRPVWFVFEGTTLYLLPVYGSDTQWYKNVLTNPKIQIDARGSEIAVKAVLVTGEKEVKSVTQKFRAKYGVGDVKKYYSKFDVAVIASIA